MNKEKFNKLAKKHLFALESYKVDKNGNTKLEVFGVDKLYEAINFTGSSLQLKGKYTPEFKEWLNYYFSRCRDKYYSPINKEIDIKEIEITYEREKGIKPFIV